MAPKPRERHPVPHLVGGLQCRCDYFQVFSRGLTLGGSWQNHLHKPSTTWAGVGIEECALIRLNIFQSQGALVLSRRAHCQCAETNDGHSNQNCGEQTYVKFSFDGIHNSGVIRHLNTCQAKTVSGTRAVLVNSLVIARPHKCCAFGASVRALSLHKYLVLALALSRTR